MSNYAPLSTFTPRSVGTTANSIVSSSSNRTRTGRRWFPLSCNKCQKSVDSTVFVCSCKCVFCEDCTYSHFKSSSNCPGCGRQLNDNDFTEIAVSDSGSKFATNPNEVLQNLLTKTSNHIGAAMTWNDMCAAILREHDAILGNTKVLIRQFIRETRRSVHAGRNAQTQVQAYQKQLLALKQDVVNLKRQHKEDVERMHEKDRQIQQLRSLLSRKSERNVDYREKELQSSSVFAVAKTSSTAMRTGQEKPAHFESYVRKREKGDLAQEEDLINLTRKKNPMGYR